MAIGINWGEIWKLVWVDVWAQSQASTSNTGWYEYDTRPLRRKREEDSLAFDHRVTETLQETYKRINSPAITAVIRETAPELKQEVKKLQRKAIKRSQQPDLSPLLASIQSLETKLRLYDRLIQHEQELAILLAVA